MRTVLFYYVFILFLLIIHLYFLIPAAITPIFNPTAELVISTGIPMAEANVEIEIQSVKLEAKVSKCLT